MQILVNTEWPIATFWNTFSDPCFVLLSILSACVKTHFVWGNVAAEVYDT